MADSGKGTSVSSPQLAGRPFAVVTGASSGIGAAFAGVLAADGFDLLLIARRAERLEQLCSELESQHAISAHPLALDLSDAAAAAKIADRVVEFGLAPAVVVNNAGTSLHGSFLDQPWESQDRLLQLMLTTPSEIVHRLLPSMIDAGSGRVITTASIGGLLPSTPDETLYGPIKRYLIALSRSLSTEYRGTGVTFTAVCPGFVRSEWFESYPPAARIPKALVASPEKVAKAAWRSAQRGDRVVVLGTSTKLTAVASKLLPANLADDLMAKALSKFKSLT